MKTQSTSHNVCYAFTSIAVPLFFNSANHFLGFTSGAYSDVTHIKYSFYAHKGLYWYSISLLDGYVANSLFFVDLSNCVRDFRRLCDSMDWQLEDSSGLADFVARLINPINERRSQYAPSFCGD